MFDSLNRLRDFLYDNNYTQDALRISDAITEYEKKEVLSFESIDIEDKTFIADDFYSFIDALAK